MSDVYTLGCDPGQAGALALLRNKILIDVWDMPVTAKLNGKGNEVNPQLLVSILDDIFVRIQNAPLKAFVEIVGAMPGNGGVSMFNFGKGYGVLIGALAGKYIPIIGVRPQQWKKKFSLIKKDKDASRTTVLAQYPEYIELFKRKKDVDRADAVLIGLYGYAHTQEG